MGSDQVLARIGELLASRQVCMTSALQPEGRRYNGPPFSVVVAVEDTLDGLLSWNALEGAVLSRGGTAAADLTQIRGSSEGLSSGGTASGPVSFMRAVDAWAGAIGGPGRGHARSVVLPATHPDVWAFIWARARQQGVEDALVRSRLARPTGPAHAVVDLPFQSANHFLNCSDDLMRAVVADDAVRVGTETDSASVGARELLRTSAIAALLSGQPRWCFSEAVSRSVGAPVVCGAGGSDLAQPPSLRLLMGVDVEAILGAPSADGVQRLLEAVDDLVWVADVALDRTVAELPEELAPAARRRPVGLACHNLDAYVGAMGLHGTLSAVCTSAAAASLITAQMVLRSAQLAEEHGVYGGFWDESSLVMSRLGGRAAALRALPVAECAQPEIRQQAAETWAVAIAAAERTGLRNDVQTMISDVPTHSLACYRTNRTATAEERLEAAAALQQVVLGGVQERHRIDGSVSPEGVVDRVIRAWQLGLATYAIEPVREIGLKPPAE